jgi:hypothetical protein
MSVPFIIHALPRSRTSWLSMFLSYGSWTCHHEKLMFMRSMADVRGLFSASNTGSAETASSYGRCLLKWMFPNIKEVVILRPVEDVMASLIAVSDRDAFTFDVPRLRKIMERGHRCLLKIAKDQNVLVVNYADLDKEETCARIFEFCLPYKFDKAWWESYNNKNIQLNFPLLIAYRQQNKIEIDGFKSLCKRELLRLVRVGEISLSGVI